MKLTTYRSASSRLFVVACLVLAPCLSKANTIKVSDVPGATNMGAGTTETSVTARAGTLTADLLSLLTAAEMKTFNGSTSEEYFTLDNARTSSSEPDSMGSFTPSASDGGGAPSARNPFPQPQLIDWNLTSSKTNDSPIPSSAAEVVPAQAISVETSNVAGHKHKKGTAAIVSNSAPNPFVQKNSGFGLSIAQATGVDQIRKVVFPLSGSDGVGGSAVPEPRFNFLLLAGVMTAVVIYGRRFRHA